MGLSQKIPTKRTQKSYFDLTMLFKTYLSKIIGAEHLIKMLLQNRYQLNFPNKIIASLNFVGEFKDVTNPDVMRSVFLMESVVGVRPQISYRIIKIVSKKNSLSLLR
jgi:hypothetical protein